MFLSWFLFSNIQNAKIDIEIRDLIETDKENHTLRKQHTQRVSEIDRVGEGEKHLRGKTRLGVNRNAGEQELEGDRGCWLGVHHCYRLQGTD